MAIQPSDVFARVCDGTFFDLLEENAWRGDGKPLWPWLALLTTDAVEEWARQSRTLQRVVGATRCHGEEVLRLLLTRRVSHVDTRRDPSPLQQFWRWAVPGESYSFMQEWWERLPSTLGPAPVTLEGIADQERRFTSLVDSAASKLEQCGGPAWAIDSLRAVVGQRYEPVRNPAVRVVFAFTRIPSSACRPGILADFRLLARAGSNLKLSNPEPFDESFLASLEHDVHARVDEGGLRYLEHDWGFLPPKMLR